jgi:hypothetical protein
MNTEVKHFEDVERFRILDSGKYIGGVVEKIIVKS